MTKESVGILLTSRGACPSGSYLPKVAKNTCSDIDIQCCVSSRLGLCFIKVGVVFHQGWGCLIKVGVVFIKVGVASTLNK